MVWTKPRTWVPDFIMRAADLNEQLRDNLLALRDEAATDRADAKATYVAQAQTQSGDGQTQRVVTLKPAATAKAPFIVEIDNTLFGTVPDPILSIGYNLNADGKRTPGFEEENAFGWKIEADYNDGSGDNKIESYFQYAGPAVRGTGYRPWFLQINRDTDASQMELVVNQLSFSIPDPANPVNNRQVLVLTDSALTMVPFDNADNRLNIRAGTGRTGILSLGHSGVDAMIDLRMGASANFASLALGNPATAAGTVGARQIFTFANNVGGVSAPGLGLGTTTPAAHVHIKSNSTNVGPLLIDGIAGQAANLTSWRDAAGAIYSKIGKLGHIITRKTAPALGDLLDGDLALATNANGDLVVVSRTAGVLKTATLAVA